MTANVVTNGGDRRGAKLVTVGLIVPVHAGAISIAHPAIDLQEINTWRRRLRAWLARGKKKGKQHKTMSRLSLLHMYY